MKIIVIATHSFPIPYKTHTGDVVILDLVNSLAELGHDVTLAAPDGSLPSPKVKHISMPASYGKFPPSAQDCEAECYTQNFGLFSSADIVHDFSIGKTIVHSLNVSGRKNTLCTLMGGAWLQATSPHNLVVWSEAHRDRVRRGATDYEGTSTPNLAAGNGFPVNDAHVVYGGVDTKFYTPTYDKKDFYLWMNRWHPAKGYRRAIEVAKATGIKLVLAGEHPDNEMFDYQKQCALEAMSLASGCSNIEFSFLPPDPEHHIAKRELYRQAKALLYCVDFQEPFGLSQVEAMACGTPIIGTKFGSVPEVVEHGVTGYVVPDTVEDLSGAVARADALNLDACRSRAVSKFDKTVMARSYLAQYERILAGESW